MNRKTKKLIIRIIYLIIALTGTIVFGRRILIGTFEEKILYSIILLIAWFVLLRDVWWIEKNEKKK